VMMALQPLQTDSQQLHCPVDQWRGSVLPAAECRSGPLEAASAVVALENSRSVDHHMESVDAQPGKFRDVESLEIPALLGNSHRDGPVVWRTESQRSFRRGPCVELPEGKAESRKPVHSEQVSVASASARVHSTGGSLEQDSTVNNNSMISIEKQFIRTDLL